MTTPLTDSYYKQRVAASFSRAATTYDEYARFQEQVLTKLFELVSTCTERQSWLDLGTGTGQGAYQLKHCFPQLNLVAMDLSFSMLQRAQHKLENTHLVCADAEHLPFADQVFDGIFSSLAIQWCPDFERLFRELFRVSKGEVVLSTLLQDSMPELRHAWQSVDQRAHHNHYPSLDQVLETATKAGFDVVVAEEQTITTYYPSVKEVVYSLKKVGASLLTSGTSAVSPKNWKAFEESYLNQKTEHGLPLSYQVALIKLIRA